MKRNAEGMEIVAIKYKHKNACVCAESKVAAKIRE
jgi:hypothetical protein